MMNPFRRKARPVGSAAFSYSENGEVVHLALTQDGQRLPSAEWMSS